MQKINKDWEEWKDILRGQFTFRSSREKKQLWLILAWEIIFLIGFLMMGFSEQDAFILCVIMLCWMSLECRLDNLFMELRKRG